MLTLLFLVGVAALVGVFVFVIFALTSLVAGFIRFLFPYHRRH